MRNVLSTCWQRTALWARRAGTLPSRMLSGLTSGSLFRASTLSVLDQAVVSGTNFATSVIIGRTCGAWELGAYYLALTIVLFSRGVQEQLVGAPYMIYSQRKSPEELKTFAGSSLVHQLILSATIVAILGLLGLSMQLPAEWQWFDLSQLKPLIFVLIGVLPLLLIREFVREMSFANLRPAVALAVDSAIATLQLSALALLGYWQLLNVPLAYIVIGGACGLASLAWFLGKRQTLIGKWATAWNDWRSNWIFARWALACQILGQTTSYIMPWALAAWHDSAATGVFGACTTLVGIANMFMLGLSNFLSPRNAQAFARGGVTELRSVLQQTIALFVVSLGAFAGLSFVIGEWVATALYGASLEGSGPTVGILALGVVANSISMACGSGLWAMDRPAANFRADVCVMTVVIIGSLTLIPPWGPIGAAMVTLLSHLVAALVRGWTLLTVMREVAAAEVAS